MEEINKLLEGINNLLKVVLENGEKNNEILRDCIRILEKKKEEK